MISIIDYKFFSFETNSLTHVKQRADSLTGFEFVVECTLRMEMSRQRQ